jgi:hypothetical protein
VCVLARPMKGDTTGPHPAEWQREHAHGLWIIDQLADLVSVDCHADGTAVTVAFTISSSS